MSEAELYEVIALYIATFQPRVGKHQRQLKPSPLMRVKHTPFNTVLAAPVQG